jgi:hypothetical protein
MGVESMTVRQPVFKDRNAFSHSSSPSPYIEERFIQIR